MRLLLVAVLAVPVVAFVVIMQESGDALLGGGNQSVQTLDDGPNEALTTDDADGNGDDASDGDVEGDGPDAPAGIETPDGESTAGATETEMPTPTPTETSTPPAAADGSPFDTDDFVRLLESEGVEVERGSDTNRCDGDDDGFGVELRLDGPGLASGTVYLWVYPDGQARDRNWTTGGAPMPRDNSCPHEGSYWNQNVVLQAGSVTDAGLRDALRTAILSLDD